MEIITENRSLAFNNDKNQLDMFQQYLKFCNLMEYNLANCNIDRKDTKQLEQLYKV